MRYEAVGRITREEYEQIIQATNPARIASALLSISYWQGDWQWIQDQLLSFIDHNDYWVRRNVIQGLGHVARVNGQLDTEKVELVLRSIAAKPLGKEAESEDEMHLRGAAEDALEDIQIFIHQRNREAQN